MIRLRNGLEHDTQLTGDSPSSVWSRSARYYWPPARTLADDEAAVPDHPMMKDRFFIGVGVVWAKSNVTANLNTGTLGLGTFIDFENDIGLKQEQC